jgi:hypothetical protein
MKKQEEQKMIKQQEELVNKQQQEEVMDIKQEEQELSEIKEKQSESYYGSNKSKEKDTLINTFISSSDNSFSIHEFKLNPEEIILFKKFVDEERSGENLQFLFDVYNFKEQTKFVRISNETYKIWFDQIYNEYFSPNAINPLNLRDRVIKGTITIIKE